MDDNQIFVVNFHLSFIYLKNFYHFKHKAKNLIKKSIYSLTELKKDKLKKFRIIANLDQVYPNGIHR